MKSTTLRMRLTLVILPPLMVIGVAVALWQLGNARATAKEIFDRSLLTTALAVAGDVIRTDGEVLSPETSALLSDTSGGQVFYHVHAPDGVFVIGYATPPVPVSATPKDKMGPTFYDGIYLGQAVRIARLRNEATIGGFSGAFTITVWQDVSLQNALIRALVTRSGVVICVLIGTVALVVWFGVGVGLRPLLDLEDAIGARSSDDLSPIRRPVPEEARGLVSTLNTLFGQVSATMDAQASFISNAAHQLRNPIAGVQAMAEAVQGAPNGQAARARAGQLVQAAQEASALANKLLALERAKAIPIRETCDLREVLRTSLKATRTEADRRDIVFRLTLPGQPVPVQGDPVMLGEAVVTLADNALRHGGAQMRHLDIAVTLGPRMACITVQDDGQGVPEDVIPQILARFGQANPGAGSGLGLSIAQEVAHSHGGTLLVRPAPPAGGFVLDLTLPLAAV